jgi:hypothetical protein
MGIKNPSEKLRSSRQSAVQKSRRNKHLQLVQLFSTQEAEKGHILMPDTLRFICAANDYDPTKIGQHFLEVLPRVCPMEEEHKLRL